MRFAIIKWPWGLPISRKWEVAVSNYSDVPNPRPNESKGNPIPINDWKYYVSVINSAKSAAWILKPQTLWINRFDEKCEPLGGCGNFVNIIGENATHWQIETLLNDRNTHTINPLTYNFQQMPWLFHKAQARGLWSGIINVGANLDAYFPILSAFNRPYAWLKKSTLELFPSLPYTLNDGRVVEKYELEGSNVYGRLRSGELIYLLKAPPAGGKPDQRTFPTSWKIQTLGVITPR